MNKIKEEINREINEKVDDVCSSLNMMVFSIDFLYLRRRDSNDGTGRNF